MLEKNIIYKGGKNKSINKMKDEDYLVHNLNKIAKHLEHLNWNLGKIMSYLVKDSKTFKKIIDEENKDGN
jgi:hypothetical protein